MKNKIIFKGGKFYLNFVLIPVLISHVLGLYNGLLSLCPTLISMSIFILFTNILAILDFTAYEFDKNSLYVKKAIFTCYNRTFKLDSIETIRFRFGTVFNGVMVTIDNKYKYSSTLKAKQVLQMKNILEEHNIRVYIYIGTKLYKEDADDYF